MNFSHVLLIPILYEDAPNYIRNEPQRAHRRGAASRRVGHKERNKEGSQENLAQPHKEMVLNVYAATNSVILARALAINSAKLQRILL
ncbi:MAG: hypothetical protein RMZ69_34180 [Nostoc sp. ChiQUE01a]|nr:hypothetical protein [Nostoc sp. ChiQUE01a]